MVSSSLAIHVYKPILAMAEGMAVFLFLATRCFFFIQGLFLSFLIDAPFPKTEPAGPVST